MGRIIIGTCVDYTYDGKGIIKDDKDTVFVDGVIIGEKVEVEIVSKTSNQTIGKLNKILEESKDRVIPFCKLANDCGGCALQHLNYKKQLEFKTNHVQSCINRIAKLDNKVNDCLGMDEPFNYRNKSQVPYAMKGNTICYGFYKNNTHDIVQMDHCHIQFKEADDILLYIKDLFKEYKLSAYNEDKRTGLLRHVLIKKGFASNEIMIVFVTTGEVFPHNKDIVKKLVSKFNNIKTIVLNINRRDTNVILGEKEIILYGTGYIEDILLDTRFKISSKSFYQVNPLQTKVLYSTAIDFANLSKEETILDAYCGIGTISLIASKKVKEVIGVEIVSDAIKDAKNNARLNNINNASFYLDDASHFMVKFSKEKEKISTVFLDPPRKGCDKQFLESLVTLSPEKIVYISCNPSTLARDLFYLKDYYNVKKIQPVDMFPHTYHVETVCVLERK